MTPDISRVTYDPSKHYSRVVMQQGRVQLDSDWNEQAEITVETIRQTFIDLVGPYAAPPDVDVNLSDPPNFAVSLDGNIQSPPAASTVSDITIGRGRYYVDGILCDNRVVDDHVTFSRQPFVDLSGPDSSSTIPTTFPFLVYLDVWEEPVTAFDDPDLLDPGLGGLDTTARLRVVWALRAEAFDGSLPAGNPSRKTAFTWPDPSNFPKTLDLQAFQSLPSSSPAWLAPTPASPPPASPPAPDLLPPGRGGLRADTSAPTGSDATSPCAIAPDAQYRGTENQLYRVEIHRGGRLVYDDNTTKADLADAPTFKWSRDNGTIAFAITAVDESGKTFTLRDFGRDDRYTLDVGDWVELFEPRRPVRDMAPPKDPLSAPPKDLLKVTAVDPIDRTVTLERDLAANAVGVPPNVLYSEADIASRRPMLRRWDQTTGVKETRDESGPPLGTILIDPTRQRDIRQDPTNQNNSLWESENSKNWFDLEDGIRVQFQRPTPDKGSVGFFRPGDYWLIPARTASNGTILWPGDDSHPPVRYPLLPHGPVHHYAPLAVVLDSASVVSGQPALLKRRRVINSAAFVGLEP